MPHPERRWSSSASTALSRVRHLRYGISSPIAETLYAHAGLREVCEVVFALPFSFELEDYVQLLTDIAGNLGPTLGWQQRAG